MLNNMLIYVLGILLMNMVSEWLNLMLNCMQKKIHSSPLAFSLPVDLIIDFQINGRFLDEKTTDI